MEYALGIDIGTTFSAAAVTTPGGDAELVNLGVRSASIPSVLLVRDDGGVLFGTAAETRAAADPTRVAREFKRRLGDPTPLVLGGTPYTAQTLTKMLLEHIVGVVTERMGAAPTTVVIGHPAAFSEYRREVLRNAAVEAGIADPHLVAEPVAAAALYEARSQVTAGEIVAIYDFGGGTFDIALVRHTEHGFELLGTPVGVDNLGGIDFDVAMLDHVNEATGGALEALDPADPYTLELLSRLRRDCREAKETLSSDDVASINVNVAGSSSNVTVTVGDFERMIRPRLGETFAALRRATESAGIRLDDIGRILLVGGSSRIPSIRQQVTAETGRPLARDIDPEYAVALGAAVLAGRELQPAARPVEPQAGTTFVAPPHSTPQRSRRPAMLIGVGALVVVALVAAVVILSGGDDAKTATTAPSSTPSSVAEVTTTVEDLPASITGTVHFITSTGRAVTSGIPSALVTLQPAETATDPETADSAPLALQPLDNFFEFTGLRGGQSFRLDATAPGWEPGKATLTTESGRISTVELVMRSADGALQGVVFNENGAPLGGATVTITDDFGNTRTATSLTQGEVGAFQFSAVETPTNVQLTITLTGFSTVALSASVESGGLVTGLEAFLLPLP